jgi:ferredoxin
MNHTTRFWILGLWLLSTSAILAGCGKTTPYNPTPAHNSKGSMLFSGEQNLQSHKTTPNWNTNTKKQSTLPIQWSNTSGSSKILGQQATVTKTVAISNTCIGCGKCARVASNTFVINNHKATVISQDYASSDAVQHAVERCPVGAISVS